MMKKSILFVSTLLALSGAVAVSASSDDLEAAKQALDDALPGVLMHNPAAIDWDQRGDDKKIKVVEAETPSGQAINARIKKRKTNAWDIALFAEIDDGVEKGDEIEIHAWIRTAKAAKGMETGETVLFVGRNEEPYDYILSENITPSTEWKLHTFKGVADADYSPGRLKVEYQLAKHAQTLEFGAFYLSNLGPTVSE